MPGYGFRLYEVKLVAGWQKSKEIDFGNCGPNKQQPVGVWMRRVLNELEKYGSLSKMPQQRVGEADTLTPIAAYEAPGERDDPQVHFESHTAAPVTRIRFEFNYGRVGRVPFALGPTRADYTDLRDRATGHTYRGLLYLPTSGTKGLFALETIPGSAHPVETVNAWLARAAVELAAQDAGTIASMKPEEAANLEPLPYKLNFKQLVNIERLTKVMQETNEAQLVLRKTTVGRDAKRSTEKVRLVSQIETVAERTAAVKVAQKLFERVVGDKEAGRSAAMAELEGLAPGNVGGFEFNDGYIQLDDKSLGKKKIGVDQIDRYFDYPVGSMSQLGSDEWERAVAAEVVSLQTLVGAELDVS